MMLNYEERCAITGINIPELLVAGHIVPWADCTPQQKLNPENGICLSALYDKAFGKALITISPDDYTIRLSSALREYETQEYYDRHFGTHNGRPITIHTNSSTTAPPTSAPTPSIAATATTCSTSHPTARSRRPANTSSSSSAFPSTSASNSSTPSSAWNRMNNGVFSKASDLQKAVNAS